MEGPLPVTLTPALDPGDFAWALGSSDIWWPARVRSAADAPPKAARDRPDDPTSLYLTCFADGPSGFYSPDRLAPFETAFDRLAAQSPSRAVARAVAAASDAYARCTEAELTCACAPAAAGREKARRSRRIAEAVAGAIPGEVLTSVREAAVDVCARSALEVAEMRGWVAAYARGVQGRCVPLAKFSMYGGLPQVREKVGDLNVDDGVFGFGEAPEVCADEGKKQRSMAELIAGLDLGGCDGDGEEVEEADANAFSVEVEEADANAVSAAKVAKRRVRKVTGLGNVEDVGVEELGSGRRERKKSKYLSPPYTLVSLKGKRPKKAGSWEDDSDTVGEAVVMGRNSRSWSVVSQRMDVYWDASGYVLDEKTSPVDVLLMELHLVALDVTYLLGSQLDHDVRGLFGRYRCETYKGSAEAEAEVDIEDLGAVKEGESVMGDGGVVAGEVGSMKKVRTPLVDGSDFGVKRRGYTKKKSIGGIIRSGTGDIESSGLKREESSHTEAGGPDGDISTQKRRRKKERVCGNGEILQTLTAGQEVNGTEGCKPAKRKYRKREKKVDVSGDGEIPQTVTAGEEMNGTEGGKPAKRKYRKREKKEEVNANVGVGVSPALIVLGANGSEEGKSEKKRRGRKKKEAIVDGVNSVETGGKMKEQANGEMGYVVGVPVTLVPNGIEQVNKEGGGMLEMNAGMVNTEVGSMPMASMVLGASGPGELEFSESANRMTKTAATINFGASLFVGAGDNGASKPKQKRQRKEATASVESGVAPTAAASEGVADNAMPKQKRSRKKKEASGSSQGATLMLSFAKDAQLPSREELITTYSKFGMLSESGTELMEDTSSASVVFTKKSDAKKAFNRANKDRVLGSSSITACELRHVMENRSAPPSNPPLPALTPKPTLEDVKKNLESMISTLTASGVNARDLLGSDEGMPSDLKENLVDEMSGLLRKVNSFFGGSPSSAGGSAVVKDGAAS